MDATRSPRKFFKNYSWLQTRKTWCVDTVQRRVVRTTAVLYEGHSRKQLRPWGGTSLPNSTAASVFINPIICSSDKATVNKFTAVLNCLLSTAVVATKTEQAERQVLPPKSSYSIFISFMRQETLCTW